MDLNEQQLNNYIIFVLMIYILQTLERVRRKKTKTKSVLTVSEFLFGEEISPEDDVLINPNPLP